jgi:hypothetical protein
MEFLKKPPKWLSDALPEGVRGILEGGGWYAVLGIVGVIILLLLWKLVGPLFRAKGPPAKVKEKDVLEEDLAAFSPLPPPGGNLRLTAEGVPVRLRLVVLAPAGTAFQIDPASVNKILDQVLPGLGNQAAQDQPRVRIWPKQLSYEGFAQTFHNNTAFPEGETEVSRWVLVAGRAKLGGQSVLIGLGLQAARPTPVGRRTLQPHEWPTVLRIREGE